MTDTTPSGAARQEPGAEMTPPLPPATPTMPPVVPPVVPAVVPPGYARPGYASPVLEPQTGAPPVYYAPPTRETEPLEYHRLYRGIKNYRWWKPLLVLVLSAAIYFAMNIVIGIVFAIVAVVAAPQLLDIAAIEALTIPDTQNPLSLLVGLGAVALMIPAVWLGMLSVGIRPLGRGWSVALRLRWGLIWRTGLLSIGAIVVITVVDTLLAPLFGVAAAAEPAAARADFDPTLALWSMLIIVLLVPFQAAAEEYVFRGMLMQVLGAWVRSPWLAMLLPTLLFALAHIYDIWGLLAVAVMGFTAAWLAWRTGGLEAAVAVHVVNNLVAFGVMATGLTGETGQTVEGAGPSSLIAQVIGLGLFAWATELIFKRGGWSRTRVDVVQLSPKDVAALG